MYKSEGKLLLPPEAQVVYSTDQVGTAPYKGRFLQVHERYISSLIPATRYQVWDDAGPQRKLLGLWKQVTAT